ncbi:MULTISPECIES: GGDEF domain-containing protein [Psychrilyobacter]|uniref:Diguanylate cyclase n=1 Tax=Psychrilyobacter piezotolerans TaxID=2293438 RepID=A0ABX9KEK9_9FUSO|nr:MULTISPECIES: GGDEF domain-containing protein [Psychrilyobacter]MCS5421696.1 GGDEF domain-containing protein [Psychrilyobacter sp. S5]NDI78861.1 diguanylate cyclase [Psychrilyobacter piezotolerans]RDE59368.1 diguanylate cyclase [Psychrilyobacter sp. S5]REI39871.1 diguanylate cyclase [Psychrilyobacter piezotolerans]
MNKGFRRSFYALYLRISAGVIIVIITTMFLSFFFIDKLLYSYLKLQYKEQVFSVISGLDWAASGLLEKKEINSLQRLTENIGSYSFIEKIRIYNTEDKIISSNNKEEVGEEQREKIVNEILIKNKLRSMEINFKEGRFKVAVPIKGKEYSRVTKSGVVGVLFIKVALRGIDKLMYDYRHNIIRNIIIVGVFLLIIILILLTKKLFIPLIKLSDAAKEVSRGNYKSKIENSSRLEFNYLIDEFNHMIEQINIRDEKLKISRKKLEDYSLLLEKKVKERTKELHLSNKNLKKIAITDGLTKVYNRKYILEKLEVEIENAKRVHEKPSVVMLDVDDFKKINDKYGHQTGDEVLKKISEFIKSNLREIDLFGRYGGEEFIIILPETNIEKSFYIAERIREEVENIRYDNENIKTTISLGVIEVVDENQNEIIRKVDKLLYKAKANGKNRVEK